MKISIAFVFLIVTLNSFSQWDTAFFHHEGFRIDDVWVFDNDNFLIAGDQIRSGQIYTTTDGGENFYVYTFDDWIQTVFFLNDSIGFAGGNDNYGIYKTFDQGRNWTLIESETFFLDVYDIYFFSEDVGFVNHWWTYDGGLSYINGDHRIRDVLKVSDSVFYARRSWPTYGIIKTEDCGLSWETVLDSISSSSIIEVDPNHHILLSGGILYHTYDLFQSFPDTTLIEEYTGNRKSIDFADSLNGFMVTFNSSYSTPRLKLLASNDGGYNWYHTDLIEGSLYWDTRDPIHCLPDQTFIYTNQVLLRSQESSIGPTEKVNPDKPGTLGNLIIPANKARNMEVESDSAGNLYVACTFEGQIEIGDTIIQNSHRGSVLYAKLDPDLNLLWLQTYDSDYYYSIPFDLYVFDKGNSVLHLDPYKDYFVNGVGPYAGNPLFLHYDKNGSIVDQLVLDGYVSHQKMDGDNSSSVFLGAMTYGTIRLDNDSLTGPVDFLLSWDVSTGQADLRQIALHNEMSFYVSDIAIQYDLEKDILQYCSNFLDTVTIDDQVYTALHQSSGYSSDEWQAFYIVEISDDGGFATVMPDVMEIDFGSIQSFVDNGFLPEGQTALLGWHKDSLYYNGEYFIEEGGERSFISLVDEIPGPSGFTYLGGKPWGIQAYETVAFGDHLIVNAHQEFKTSFGQDMIYNTGNMYKDDNVFLFYDQDLNFEGYYQLIDQENMTDLEVRGDRIFLGGSSADNAIEFDNETFYNNGDGFYYITGLDFQYLRVDEPSKTKVNSLRIFPNPTKEQFKIEIPEGCSEGAVEVYSLQGQLLYFREFSNENEMKLKLNVPPGAYLVKLSGNRSVYSTKLIITR